MTLTEHLQRFAHQDYSPRIVERQDVRGERVCYAWFPTWEGPARYDYPAALADLRDRDRK